MRAGDAVGGGAARRLVDAWAMRCKPIGISCGVSRSVAENCSCGAEQASLSVRPRQFPSRSR